jgi:hypothetical protein
VAYVGRQNFVRDGNYTQSSETIQISEKSLLKSHHNQ